MDVRPTYVNHRFGTKPFAIQEAVVIATNPTPESPALPPGWSAGSTLYIPGRFLPRNPGATSPATKASEPVKLIERIGTGVKGAGYAGTVFSAGHLASSTSETKLLSFLSNNGVANLSPEHAQNAAETIKGFAASRTGKAIVVGITAGVFVVGVLEAVHPAMSLRMKIAIALVVIAVSIAAFFILSHLSVIS